MCNDKQKKRFFFNIESFSDVARQAGSLLLLLVGAEFQKHERRA
jgi:hypothetical protein